MENLYMDKRWTILDSAIEATDRWAMLRYVQTDYPATLRINELPEVHQRLVDTIGQHYDLSSCKYVEQWHNAGHSKTLPTEHLDKDERLWESTGEIRTPICSSIMYLSVKNLRGANLEIDITGLPINLPDLPKFREDQVQILKPKESNIVLMDPGVWHKVTPFESGHRVAYLMNFWDSPLHNQEVI